MAARPPCLQWQTLQLCSGTLGIWCNAGHLAHRAIGGGPSVAPLGELWRIERLSSWTIPGGRMHSCGRGSWLVVNRSGETCGFVVYTPRGDEYVEALTDGSFYAQTARAYPAEVKGGVVQFSEGISDDEMIRLIRAGRGMAEGVQRTHLF